MITLKCRPGEFEVTSLIASFCLSSLLTFHIHTLWHGNGASIAVAPHQWSPVANGPLAKRSAIVYERGRVDWAVEGSSDKRGAGVLFFAYGAPRSIDRFLGEAGAAAKSLREHNPLLSIAIVTNANLSGTHFSNGVFDKVLCPRPDLLFAGDTSNGGQNRRDAIPRQWLTRLYYMAHSPYLITWALDSNVISCTPGAALAFLSSASSTGLWGYDMVTALAPKHPQPSPQLRQEPNPYPRRIPIRRAIDYL